MANDFEETREALEHINRWHDQLVKWSYGFKLEEHKQQEATTLRVLETIKSALQQAQKIESGECVVVPREPTTEMCEAGGDIIRDGEVRLEGALRLSVHGWGGFHVYKAMLYAAPINPEEKD